jgi:Putative rhamnosyl transferase
MSLDEERSPDSVGHVVLTRFNLPSAGLERIIRAEPGWLESRVALFERYCLPSVAGQTMRPAAWIVYFDPDSPAWLRERIGSHGAPPPYHARFRAEVSTAELLADIEQVIGDGHAELVTTNLDNDDALARDFCERLRSQPAPGRTTAYYFVNGLIRTGSAVYEHRDAANAFPSVRAVRGEAATCWSGWHTVLGDSMPVVEIHGAPGWLQVVHGRNVSNRTRGRLADPSSHAGAFPGLLDDLASPGRAARSCDHLVLHPARRVRDQTVRLLKPAVVRILGRSGPDRLRQLRARLVGRDRQDAGVSDSRTPMP